MVVQGSSPVKRECAELGRHRAMGAEGDESLCKAANLTIMARARQNSICVSRLRGT